MAAVRNYFVGKKFVNSVLVVALCAREVLLLGARNAKFWPVDAVQTDAHDKAADVCTKL